MSFSESSLLKKFTELNNTQQSVQTLSLWLIHHRKHAKLIINLWLKELKKETANSRKLTFIYLANDILQNSRKKGPEYSNEFGTVLQEAFNDVALKADDKMKISLGRILNIWKERKVYSEETIEKYKQSIHQVKLNEDDNVLRSPVEVKSSTFQKVSRKPSESSSSDSDAKKPKLNDTPFQITETMRDEVLKKFQAENNEVKAPEANEMLSLLQDLEKSASSDAIVREKIAQLPPQISDLNILKTLKDQKDIQDLLGKVKDALELLDNYNNRLQDELETRKKTSLQLNAFIKQHKSDLDTDNNNASEWKKKLEQVMNVKKELDIHYQSLPDLSVIEDSALLNPLPSAGDLFS